MLIYLSVFGIAGFGFALTGPTENFTTYTKSDPKGQLAITSSRISVSELGRDSATFVYRDMGVDWFGNFIIEVEASITNQDQGADAYVLTLANLPGSTMEIIYDQLISVSIQRSAGGVYRIHLSNPDAWWDTSDVSRPFLFHLERSGSTVTLTTYVGGAIVSTLTIQKTTKYRYIYALNSANLQVVSAWSGYIANLRIDGSTPPPGETGAIAAHCILNGNPLQGVSVSVSGPSSGTGTTNSAGVATISNLQAGTYTVQGYYSGNGITRTNTGVIVVSGHTADTYFDFTPGGTSTGSVYVAAQDSNGQGLSTTVSLSGGPSSPASQTTPCTFGQLAFGSYTVIGTYSGETKTQSVTISASSPTSSVTLHFSATGPPDILAEIRAFFNNPTVKNLFLWSGIGTATISGILVILPEKRRSSPYPYY
jgi:hypothetical protein